MRNKKISYLFRGFTLIELLVVISIISLLSSIVLSSFSSARSKGRDAKRITEFNQIKNALYAHQAQYGEFPPDNGTSWTCFGAATGEICYNNGTGITGNDNLKAAMDIYFSKYPEYGVPNFTNLLYRRVNRDAIVTLATEDMTLSNCVTRFGGVHVASYTINQTNLKACDIRLR